MEAASPHDLFTHAQKFLVRQSTNELVEYCFSTPCLDIHKLL